MLKLLIATCVERRKKSSNRRETFDVSSCAFDVLLPLHLLESFFELLDFLCLSLQHDFVENKVVDVRLIFDLLAVQAEPEVLVSLMAAGVRAQMMAVREIPPSESFRIRVSLDRRYGTKF